MEKQVDIEGLRINYDESGQTDGPVVLILHGWGCNHTTVKSIAACLNGGMRVLSLDLPGHGQSEEPSEIWGTFDFANFLEKFIQKLHLSVPSLIGHSFGGRTSIAYASKNKVSKIVLIDSAGLTPKRSFKYYYKVYSYKLYKKLLLSVLGEEKGKKVLEKAIKKRGSADYQAASPIMRAIMSKCINEDLRKHLKDIKAPTLLIWGENDTATPISDAKIMESNIPDSGLVSFPNSGHYSFLDNPMGFQSVIREFFKQELSK